MYAPGTPCEYKLGRNWYTGTVDRMGMARWGDTVYWVRSNEPGHGTLPVGPKEIRVSKATAGKATTETARRVTFKRVGKGWGERHEMYQCIETLNTLNPRAGDRLTEPEVQRLIDDGVHVVTRPRKAG